MVIVNMLEAKTNLSRLVQRAVAGEDVYIARNGQPVAQIITVAKQRTQIGVAEGRYVFPDDFDQQFDELDTDIAAMFAEAQRTEADG